MSFYFNNFNNNLIEDLLLAQILLQSVSTKPEYTECLEYLKENYYPNADMTSYLDIIIKIYDFKQKKGRFPDRTEFFMMFRVQCSCRYYVEDQHYLRACEFFIRNRKDVTRLGCSMFYFFYEFYMLEQREPRTYQEFDSYMGRTLVASINPESIQNDTIPRPVDEEKVVSLKDRMFSYDEKEDKSCSICQEEFKFNQKCVRLDCDHYFHGDEKDCCETGTIFKWFEENKVCPMCRKEI